MGRSIGRFYSETNSEQSPPAGKGLGAADRLSPDISFWLWLGATLPIDIPTGSDGFAGQATRREVAILELLDWLALFLAVMLWFDAAVWATVFSDALERRRKR